MDYMKRSIMKTGMQRVLPEEQAIIWNVSSQEEKQLGHEADQDSSSVEFYDDFVSGEDYLDLYTE